MNKGGCVLIKFYFSKEVAGWIWSMEQSVLPLLQGKYLLHRVVLSIALTRGCKMFERGSDVKNYNSFLPSSSPILFEWAQQGGPHNVCGIFWGCFLFIFKKKGTWRNGVINPRNLWRNLSSSQCYSPHSPFTPLKMLFKNSPFSDIQSRYIEKYVVWAKGPGNSSGSLFE